MLARIKQTRDEPGHQGKAALGVQSADRMGKGQERSRQLPKRRLPLPVASAFDTSLPSVIVFTCDIFERGLQLPLGSAQTATLATPTPALRQPIAFQAVQLTLVTG